MLTVEQWLHDKISKAEIHKDYLSIYNWIVTNYNEYKDQYQNEPVLNGDDLQKLDEGAERFATKCLSGLTQVLANKIDADIMKIYEKSEDAKPQVKEFPCSECGAKKRWHYRGCPNDSRRNQDKRQ